MLMDKNMNKFLTVLFCCIAVSGCVGPRPLAGPMKEPASVMLAEAEKSFLAGKYTDAMIRCVDLARVEPDLPGLEKLQEKIMRKLAEERAKSSSGRSAMVPDIMSADIQSRDNIPYTYGLHLPSKGESGSLKTPETPMEQILQKKVTVHLDGVGLNDFILQIGSSEGVNIVADSALGAADPTGGGGGTMTIHAEDVPLAEILDYVSRNLSVSFYVGDNIIWATPSDDAAPTVPLQTRMYRLRRGISSEELGAGDEGAGGAMDINIVEAINRFIPTLDGSDLLFDKKAHVLLVKNTRENLSAIERIIETLDVCPPQVTIEARFISTSVDDLLELGIDWILNSSVALTEKTILRNNVRESADHTRIDEGASIEFLPFETSAQGLNLTYQGILTDPMFKAVLHALETCGQSRTLSVPKITTVNNRTANIRIGEDFRYFEEYDIQSVASTREESGVQMYDNVLVPIGLPQLEELGIELSVMPSVGADMKTITLQMNPEISEFARWEYYEVGSRGGSTTATNALSTMKLPIFRRSSLETEVIVQSGETVVMGGLISSTQSTIKHRVPFLSSLPLIGNLFTRNQVENTKQNLLIFVTASILSSRGENLVPMVSALETPAGGSN